MSDSESEVNERTALMDELEVNRIVTDYSLRDGNGRNKIARDGHSSEAGPVEEDGISGPDGYRQVWPPPNADQDEVCKQGAAHVIELFIPVSLSMLIVVITLNKIKFYASTTVYSVYTPFHEDSQYAGTKFWNALANAGILLTVIVLMTVILIVLYKYRCYKIIHGWLMLSSLILLSLFSGVYLTEILKACNIAFDYITLGVILWNFGVVGMICIHWKGPLRLQQAYLIFIAALMALFFIKYLPEWTTWVVLAVVSIWDLVAVLTPNGPLRILVETAQERNEQIFPALIYSSTVVYGTTIGDGGTSSTSAESSTRRRPEDEAETDVADYRNNERGDPDCGQLDEDDTDVIDNGGFTSEWEETRDERSERRRQEVGPDNAKTRSRRPPSTSGNVSGDQRGRSVVVEDDEERGVKLGLGDFIFYGVLVGKASLGGDWGTTLACFIAILIGLCLTLLLLAIFKKALPALPISITFGLIFYFAAREIGQPFSDTLSMKQVFL